jgi:F0F1-type ATP synthase membrane subunit b/b'
MSLLQSLGIDITVIVQLAIAATTFLILATAVFSAFQKSYLERLNNTIGSQASAEETLEKIEIVKQSYEERVKALNQEIKKIFDQERLKAKDYLAQKQNQVKKDIEEMRLSNQQHVQIQIKAVQEKRSEIVNELSNYIYDQLVSQR